MYLHHIITTDVLRPLCIRVGVSLVLIVIRFTSPAYNTPELPDCAFDKALTDKVEPVISVSARPAQNAFPGFWQFDDPSAVHHEPSLELCLRKFGVVHRQE